MEDDRKLRAEFTQQPRASENPFESPLSDEYSPGLARQLAFAAWTLVMFPLVVLASLLTFCCTCMATGIVTWSVLGGVGVFLGFVVGLACALYVSRFLLEVSGLIDKPILGSKATDAADVK